MNAPQRFPLARDSAGPAPLRRAGSVRRTTTIDVHWPDGFGQPKIMEGTARDLVTPVDGGEPVVAAQARYRLKVSAAREIMEIDTTPVHPKAQEMIGIRGGGDSRIALGRIMGDICGSPLYQIMDDFAGASLVSNWAWSLWVEDWSALIRGRSDDKAGLKLRNMTNICTGFAAGSSALSPDGLPGNEIRNKVVVGTLINPDDPEGWHPLPDQQGTGFRRARRIDVWREEAMLQVDVGFQDSGPNPQGGRTAVHEYQVSVTINASDMTVQGLAATPHILPFAECPGAVANIQRLVGHPVAAFRQDVLDVLPGIKGCTHLNDVLRALADVPVLAKLLPD
jgi:Protein of unknown function (DUF2889)